MSDNKDFRRKLGIWAIMTIAVRIMISSAIASSVVEVAYALCTLLMIILVFLIIGYIPKQWSTIKLGEMYA